MLRLKKKSYNTETILIYLWYTRVYVCKKKRENGEYIGGKGWTST